MTAPVRAPRLVKWEAARAAFREILEQLGRAPVGEARKFADELHAALNAQWPVREQR